MGRTEQIKAYKEAGHTAKETAEQFNLSVGYVRRICAGIAPQSYGPGRTKTQRDIKQMVEACCPGFEYIAGTYTGADGTVDLRCKTCGEISTRSMITVRHNNVRCRFCESKRIQKRDEDKRREQRLKELRTLSNKDNKSTQLVFIICKQCGRVFISNHPGHKYCSDKCRRQGVKESWFYNRSSDDRLTRDVVVDKDITLRKLFERDAGRCWICGELCDWNDAEYKDGVFVSGNNYPSKDHIIPLAKGGKHSWNNIKLAHRRCNSKKYTKII